MSVIEDRCPECGRYDDDCSCIDGGGGERRCQRCGDSFNLDEGGIDFTVDWGGSLCPACEDG